MSIAVVTDSTASLPSEVTDARGIHVVALEVVIGSDAYQEGTPEATPERVAEALREKLPVSTSRPPPEAVLEVYRRAVDAGAESIVSVHLSGEMSGTYESAQLAAARSPVPVACVDTRQVGAATGYAALAAADAIDAGADTEAAAKAARSRAEAARSFFYVDTLEYLRRGGRVGAAARLLGGALAVKPLLTIADGVVAPLERVRTSSRALARLEELAVEAAAEQQVDLYVAHLANQERADELAERLTERLAENLGGREPLCGEIGPVLGAHVGPGMIATCVAPLLD